MIKLTCPIDNRVLFQVPDEFGDYQGHCTTDKPNGECPFIFHGCIGCRFDKEALIPVVNAVNSMKLFSRSLESATTAIKNLGIAMRLTNPKRKIIKRLK